MIDLDALERELEAFAAGNDAKLNPQELLALVSVVRAAAALDALEETVAQALTEDTQGDLLDWVGGDISRSRHDLKAKLNEALEPFKPHDPQLVDTPWRPGSG